MVFSFFFLLHHSGDTHLQIHACVCHPLMLIRCYQQHEAGDTMRLKRHGCPLRRFRPICRGPWWRQRITTLCTTMVSISMPSWLPPTRILRGKGARGSTISQQTAKNVFLWPSRNWIRKGLSLTSRCSSRFSGPRSVSWRSISM